jgi:hypothetical protein
LEVDEMAAALQVVVTGHQVGRFVRGDVAPASVFGDDLGRLLRLGVVELSFGSRLRRWAGMIFNCARGRARVQPKRGDEMVSELTAVAEPVAEMASPTAERQEKAPSADGLTFQVASMERGQFGTRATINPIPAHGAAFQRRVKSSADGVTAQLRAAAEKYMADAPLGRALTEAKRRVQGAERELVTVRERDKELRGLVDTAIKDGGDAATHEDALIVLRTADRVAAIQARLESLRAAEVAAAKAIVTPFFRSLLAAAQEISDPARDEKAVIVAELALVAGPLIEKWVIANATFNAASGPFFLEQLVNERIEGIPLPEQLLEVMPATIVPKVVPQ